MKVIEIIAVTIGVVVGAGGIIATIWAVGKVKGVEVSIDLLSSANEALRKANEDLRIELAHAERICAERLARLEGQNTALLDGLGDKLAQAIAARLEPVLMELARHVVLGMTEPRSQGLRTRSADYVADIARHTEPPARDSDT